MRLSWKHGYRYCEAKTKRGKPCGNLVPKGIRRCHVHRSK